MQDQLESLARGWDVSIRTALNGNYVVTLSNRNNGAETYTYSDPRLDRAVSRAWAGGRG